jgi:hypothetical protein
MTSSEACITHLRSHNRSINSSDTAVPRVGQGLNPPTVLVEFATPQLLPVNASRNKREITCPAEIPRLREISLATAKTSSFIYSVVRIIDLIVMQA